MNYREMTEEQKDFLKGVVANNYNSKARKSHTKNQVALSCKAAFKNEYGVWPHVTSSTIDTLLERLKSEDGMIIVPESTGKGMICTWGRGKNETPALIDHFESVTATQKKIASGIRNLGQGAIFQFSIQMLPASKVPQDQVKVLLGGVSDGNKLIAGAVQDAEKFTQIKYKQIPYYEDENGNEVQINQLGE